MRPRRSRSAGLTWSIWKASLAILRPSPTCSALVEWMLLLFFALSSSFRRMIAFRLIRGLWFVVSHANVLQFEPLILVVPAGAAGAAAGAVNVPLTAEQRLGNEFISLQWPVSENGLLGPFADVMLTLAWSTHALSTQA